MSESLHYYSNTRSLMEYSGWLKGALPTSQLPMPLLSGNIIKSWTYIHYISISLPGVVIRQHVAKRLKDDQVKLLLTLRIWHKVSSSHDKHSILWQSYLFIYLFIYSFIHLFILIYLHISPSALLDLQLLTMIQCFLIFPSFSKTVWLTKRKYPC